MTGCLPVSDLEAIKQLKARYFRFLDTKQWDELRTVFAEGVEMDTTDAGGGVVTGAGQLVSFLETTLQGTTTVHHGHMPEINGTSPTTASGVWAMQDLIRWPDGSEMVGFGHYHETY